MMAFGRGKRLEYYVLIGSIRSALIVETAATIPKTAVTIVEIANKSHD